MVEMRVCSFCGREIEPGTGSMYVKKDGTILLFCTNKCSKNMIDMKRVPRRVTWTRAYAREKDVRMKGPETEAKLLRKEAKKAAKAAALKPEVKPIEAPVEAVVEAIPAKAEEKPEVKVEEKLAVEKPAKAKKVKAEKPTEEPKPAKAKKAKAEKPAEEKKD
jgi:large subunit ribosomal protein L24e